MYFIGLIYFYSLLNIIVYADLQKCDGTKTIDHSTNLNESYYWPAGWAETMNYVPQFDTGQNCVWKFNVPKGMYAYFGASFTPSDSTTLLTMTDSLGVITTFNQSDFNHPFFLVDPGFTVELHSTSIGYLGMRIAWFKIPQSTPTIIPVVSNDAPLALIGDTFNNATTIKAETRVSLVSLRPPQADDNDVPTMRMTLVFDGPSINSTFLGNLWQVMISDNHIVSSGQYLTIYSVWPGKILGNIAIVQDYSNVQTFKNYKGINCYLNNRCNFQLDSQTGNSAAIRYYQNPHYLIRLDIPQKSQVIVNSGALNVNSTIAKYVSDNIKISIPQKFSSLFTTYSLNQGIGNFVITSRSDLSDWSMISNNRQGSIFSKNQGVLSMDQNFSEFFSGEGSFNINLTITDAGLTDSSYLKITVLQDQTTVLDKLYTYQNLPEKQITAKGNRLNVQYLTNGSKTKGCQLEFSFQNSAKTIEISLSFLIIMIVNMF